MKRLLALVTLLLSSALHAQSWPAKPQSLGNVAAADVAKLVPLLKSKQQYLD